MHVVTPSTAPHWLASSKMTSKRKRKPCSCGTTLIHYSSQHKSCRCNSLNLHKKVVGAHVADLVDDLDLSVGNAVDSNLGTAQEVQCCCGD